MTVFADSVLRAPAGSGAGDLSPRVLGTVAHSMLLLAAGAHLSGLFVIGRTPGLRTGVVTVLVLTVWGLLCVRVTRAAVLPRLMVLMYALPFTSLTGYLWNPDFRWLFGDARGVGIARDPEVIRVLLAFGNVGFFALIAGMLFSAALWRQDVVLPRARRQLLTLDPVVYSALIIVAVVFSWIGTPPETLLASAYGDRTAPVLGTQLNFAAAFLVSYILLLALAIDTDREHAPGVRRWKLVTLVGAVVYIVVVLQVFRGERESSGLIAGLAGLYITSPRYRGALRTVLLRRYVKIGLPLALMGVLFLSIGAVRGSLREVTAHATPLEIVRFGYVQSTWTAVLRTNLSAAWEYHTGVLVYRRGETYTQYLASLPPGIITRALGITRPLDLDQGRGLAYEDLAQVTAGGMHTAVIPFRNFGVFGVLAIMFAYGVFIGWLEARAAQGRFGIRLLWAASVCASFLWFWYGDLAYIRALMISGLIYISYRIALSVQWQVSPHVVARLGSRSPTEDGE